MKAFIYDYDDTQSEITFKDKPIEIIFVIKISGDELFTVVYSDGEIEEFDATLYTKAFRTMSFFDGCYVVKKEEIEKWARMEKEERDKK